MEVGIRGSMTGALSLDLADLLVAIGNAAKARNRVVVLLIDERSFCQKTIFQR